MLAEVQSASTSLRVRPAPGSSRAHAVDLIAETVDPETGHVNVRKLATWVFAASLCDIAAASRAYSTIEAQLLLRSPADVARFNQEIVEAARRKPGRTARGAASLAAARNPVLSRQWNATDATTGRASFTAALKTLLENNGIRA